MKEDFSVHNLFWKGLDDYKKFDPQLSKLNRLPYIYHPPLIKEVPVLTPGIYILTGGRQVGKSTTIKLLIKDMLERKKVPPNQIYFLPCDIIKDFTGLLFEIDQFRQSLTGGYFMLFIDEITYVKDWHRAIKSLADAGFFNNGSVLITGSDTCLLKDALMAFPGRRGQSPHQDFHLFPLSFYEYVKLKDPTLKSHFEKIKTEFQEKLMITNPKTLPISRLQELFNEYLLTGGYLLAINDYEKNKMIGNAAYKTYIQWIVGDVLKRGKDEKYLKEIIRALFPRLLKQVTWHSFIGTLSIEHHQTIIDYLDLLSRMDVAIILQALREDKLRPAPKKAKKICFSDPFILHALHGWINNKESIFDLASKSMAENSELKDALIEGAISSLFHRQRELYYIKAEGEVDLALVFNNKFFPVEIKNTLILNSKELKQILKYKRGLVAYAGTEIGNFKHLQVIPIPLLAYLAG